MIVLGIETATSICSVGLTDENGFLAECRIDRGTVHAERLPVLIENILTDTGISSKEIHGIAVSLGPGSFTGLRIGLALAKGLAMGWEKPLIGVPTMNGLVFSAPRILTHACVLLTARKGEFYLGIFQIQKENWILEGEIEVVETDEILQCLPAQPTLILGEGAIKLQQRIQDKRPKDVFLSGRFSLPSGFSVAEKGMTLFAEGKVSDVDSLVPLYVKRFQGVA